MKKALKHVIPIFLILVLLAAGYWFFFRYRTDLTASWLVSLADGKLEAGSYGTAIRYYNWAAGLHAPDTETSLQMARAYRMVGNYTKTEYVLGQAIEAEPDNADLYFALSQVYVAQDKLLDAAALFDKLPDSVRPTLEAQRPAAPVFSPASGYYSEYITVSLEPQSGATLYWTVDGHTPSLSSDAYGSPYALPGGISTLRAVAVGENGLVSSFSGASYTVAGIVEDVVFADPAVERTVQTLLHREGRTVRTDELWDIEDLELPEDVTCLDDLHYFTSLVKLTAHGLRDVDYAPLAGLDTLRYLDLSHCALETADLEQIGACTALEVLKLSGCGLSNLSPLDGMTELRTLDLSDNSISTILWISGLETVDTLDLSYNALTTLPTLKRMKSLRVLDLSYNALSSATGVSTCPSLRTLDLSHNKLTSINAVSALTELERLDASNNQVTELSALSACKGLTSFTMTDNKLEKIDFLADLPNLTEINVDYNDIVALPAFAKDAPLERISAAHNFLEALDPLAGLPCLISVNADYNNISSIDVLADCPVLAQVSVYGTNVHSGGKLEEKGVVVNFTPAVN